MNRAELVDALSTQTSLSKAECERFLAAFINTVEKNLKKKEEVKLVGFGTFTTTKRKARIGRNPQTRLPVTVFSLFSLYVQTLSITHRSSFESRRPPLSHKYHSVMHNFAGLE